MRGSGKIPIIDGVMTAGGTQLNVLHALSLSGLKCCSGKIGNGGIRVCNVGEECVVRDRHFSCRPHRCSAVQHETMSMCFAGQSGACMRCYCSNSMVSADKWLQH